MDFKGTPFKGLIQHRGRSPKMGVNSWDATSYLTLRRALGWSWGI